MPKAAALSLDLLFDGARIPAAVLEERVRRSVGLLRAQGVGAGDVVALMLHNHPVLVELMLALRRMGAIWCPVNWHFKADELAYVLRDSGARLFVAEPALLTALHAALPPGLPVFAAGDADAGDAAGRWPRWEAARDAAAPDTAEPAAPRGPMLYTSGTTGRPKGIRREPATPAQSAALLDRLRACYGLEPGMRALLVAPWYHSAPNSFVLGVAQTDGATLLIERRFDAERTLQLIAEHRLTHAYLVPTMYVRMLRLPDAVKRRHDLSSMRFVSSTGSPCPPEVKRAMIDWWGPVFHESYGASELGYMTCADSHDALARPGTAGRALAHVGLAILDAEGRPQPAGTPGLIYVRQHEMADFSYQGNDAARRAMERDGFLTMGDIGYLDDDGYLFIVDRQADLVISGGVNIYPVEIEQVLLGMPGVADCAVFGIPHAEYGEALAAALQLQPGAQLTAEEVRAWVRAHLAGYKVPAEVTFHEALPREDTGKIFKRHLRAPYWEGRARQV
jgi:long-chain acyl-CoA synthetase